MVIIPDAPTSCWTATCLQNRPMAIAHVTHEALLALLRRAMAEEVEASRFARHAQEPTSEVPAVRWPQVESQELLAAIRQHRLEILLDSHRELLAIPEDVASVLRERAWAQHMQALPLVAGASEAIRTLAGVGIRSLLFKGPALAVQTTGDLTARGGGDVDLLVDPEAIAPAIEALASVGFFPMPGFAPRRLHSRSWSYARWAVKELPLLRGPVLVDLHWSLTNMRRCCPSFEEVWRDHGIVSLGGHELPTLSLPHALVHSCAHAANDRWMHLRSLVDIDRLTRLCPPATSDDLLGSVAVQLSCAVAHQATSSPHLSLPSTLRPGRLDRALELACRSQREPPLAHQRCPWQLRGALMLLRQRLELAAGPGDWLRIAAAYALPPAVFNDPVTGEDRSLPMALASRLQRARERFGERLKV